LTIQDIDGYSLNKSRRGVIDSMISFKLILIAIGAASVLLLIMVAINAVGGNGRNS